MKRILPLVMVLIAGQASALQCLRPDPVRAFQAAMAAPGTYVVLRGQLAEAEILIPLLREEGQPYPVPVWFSGMVLTRDGFTQTLQTPMTVQVACLGPWCAAPPAEVEILAFAQVVDGASTIEADLCNSWIYPSDPLTQELLLSCIRGKACVPADALD